MKRLLLVPTLLLLLCGCTKSDLTDIIEVGDIEESTPITFNVDNESLTRGTVVETEAAMGSVGMYCAYTAQEDWGTSTEFNKMDNAQFDYNSSTTEWDYSTQNNVDQPTWGFTSITDKYTFYAYSPNSSTNSNIVPSAVDGALQIAYTVPELFNEQVDLLVATPRKDIYPQASGKINMEFNHALSKVSFSIKGNPTLMVTSITLTGIQGNGTLTFDDNDAVQWSDNTKSQSFTVSAGGGLINELITDATISKNITTDDGYLFMIPQTLTESASLQVTVTNPDDKTDVETTTFSLSGDVWDPSRYYTYTIDITHNKIESFTVSVSDWYEGDDKDTETSSDPYVDPQYWINLDDMATTEDLTARVTEILEQGITQFVLVGTYNDDIDLGYKSYYEMVDGKETLIGEICGLNITADNEAMATKVDLSRVYNLTSIDTRTFSGNANLTEVILPETIESIGDYAFTNCSSLVSVGDMPNITSIGINAFDRCSSLTDISFPNIENIGVFAFSYCQALTKVDDMPKLTSIGSNAFGYCTSLVTVGDMNNLTTLTTAAFVNCSKLSTVGNMSNVTKVESMAFARSTNLKYIGDLSQVEEVGSYAFQNNKMTTMDMPLLKTIGAFAFWYCTSLTSVDFPSVETIGINTFNSCSNLETVKLGSAKTIGYASFYAIKEGANIYLTAEATKDDPICINFNDGTDYKDHWYTLNLFISNTTVLDESFIVTDANYNTDPNDDVLMSYQDGGAVADGYYYWKSIMCIDPDTGEETEYIHLYKTLL